MRLVADTLRHNLENQDTLFIFPSEVVAAFWRRQALTLTSRHAVRSDRFISWDTFKEEAFVHRREAVPANSIVRLCFAADLLNKNADGKDFLKALVLDPDNMDTLYALSDYYLKRGKLQKAKRMAEHMVAKNPGHRIGHKLLEIIEKNLTKENR